MVPGAAHRRMQGVAQRTLLLSGLRSISPPVLLDHEYVLTRLGPARSRLSVGSPVADLLDWAGVDRATTMLAANSVSMASSPVWHLQRLSRTD